MTALLLFTLAACTKTKDADPTDDTQAEETEPPEREFGYISGKVLYPGGGLSADTKLHVAIKSGDLQIWTESDHREEYANPTLPYEFQFEATPGTYYLGAFLDLTGDSPGGPNQGDPEGVAKGETGPYEVVVVKDQTVEPPPINLKVKEPQGQ